MYCECHLGMNELMCVQSVSVCEFKCFMNRLRCDRPSLPTDSEAAEQHTILKRTVGACY